MYRPLIALTALASVACTPGSSTFEHQADLDVSARGVALGQDGIRGQVGMAGTTCAVDSRTAVIGADIDYGAGEEVVRDAAIVDGRETYLIESADGLHFQDGELGLEPADELGEAGALADAKLFDFGAVALTDDQLLWTTGERARVGSVLNMDVAGDGTAFVADGLLREVGPEGTAVLGDADWVAHDRALDVLYAAVGTELRILDRDGAELAMTEFSGVVRAVEDLGERGQALVVVERDNGTGELVVVDGQTGEIAGRVITPGAADAVATSGNGRTIAVTVPSGVHFFGVN